MAVLAADVKLPLNPIRTQCFLLTFIRTRSIMNFVPAARKRCFVKQNCSKAMTELNRLYKEYDNIYARYSAAQGVSTTTLCVLYSMYTAEGPCTQAQIVEDWGVPPQTVNSCLKTLEKDGLVRLKFVEGSRKSKQILFTEKGEALAESVAAPLIRRENEAFDGLTRQEQEQLLRIIHKHNGLLRGLLLGQN